MTEIERGEDGRIEKVRIPYDDATKEVAMKVEQGINHELATKETFAPQKVAKAIFSDLLNPHVPGEKQQTLNWRYVTRLLNRMCKPGKVGPHERVDFFKNLPDFWTTVCEIGTDEQKAWVKKRIARFAKTWGFEIVVPDNPKTLKKIIKEYTTDKGLEKAVQAVDAE